jgi:CRP-like cAMP-binding protein
MEPDAIKKLIMKIPFFKAFTDHEMTRLIGRNKIFKDCRHGEYIFQEGDQGSSLFVILLGQVNLIKKGEGGKESIIAALKNGTLFGEVAMLTGNKRNLDARAFSTKVVVMEFTRDLIDKMIPSVQSKFDKQLLFIMATNLDKMNERYEKLESTVKLKK